MNDKEIIDEAKTMAIHINDEQDAWRGSNARKTVFFGYYNHLTNADKLNRVRSLFGQAFRGEI